jgi:hypothetical protein
MQDMVDTMDGTGSPHGMEAMINSIQIQMAVMPVVWLVTLELILDIIPLVVDIICNRTGITVRCINRNIKTMIIRIASRAKATFREEVAVVAGATAMAPVVAVAMVMAMMVIAHRSNNNCLNSIYSSLAIKSITSLVLEMRQICY